MSELLRSQDLKLREESGDASAAVVPTIHLRVEHPFRVGDRVRAQTGEFYYWFPRECLWSASAQGCGQVRGAVIANSTVVYKGMVEMAFFMANLIGEGMENELQKQFVTWTVVPRANDPNTYAGFLLRCTYQIEMTEVQKIMSEYLKANTVAVEKAAHKGQSILVNSSLPSYKRFTHDSYVTMCDYYMGQSVGDRSRGFQDLDDPLNPYNPEKIFGLKSAIRKMRNAGAAAEFCLEYNYLDAQGSTVFPRDGDCSWLLAPSQLHVADLRRVYMPHATRAPVDLSNPEFAHFVRNAQGFTAADAADDDDDAVPDGYDSEAENQDQQPRSRAEKMERLRKDFAQVSSQTDGDASNNLLSFKKRVDKRMAAARVASGGDRRKWILERQKAKVECIRWFMTEIYTNDETADVGESLKSMAKWFNEYLAEELNFMMPTAKFTSNLSRFADFQLRESASCESVWAINTAHAEIRSLRLACMHVYFYSPFHSHTCLFGQPGAGKSNAFQVNNMMMIDGTTRDIGCESAKAKMTPGKKTDLAIETYEDIPPSQLGVSNSWAEAARGARP